MRPFASLSLLLLLLLLLAPLLTWARELRAPAEDMIPMEFAEIGISTVTGTPVVVLREPQSGDTVPVVIGPPEANAILMGLNDVPVPRPMTHDLISNILSAAGVRLERIIIDALEEGTYHGALELRADGGTEPIYVDARPSDSLAIAVREKASIFMAPAVLQAARQPDLEAALEGSADALGISVIAVTDTLRKTLGLEDRAGVLVSRSAGPAAAAGVPAGALITSVNGRTPATPEAFVGLIEDAPPEDPVRIVYWIDGDEHEVALARGRSEPPGLPGSPPKLRI